MSYFLGTDLANKAAKAERVALGITIDDVHILKSHFNSTKLEDWVIESGMKTELFQNICEAALSNPTKAQNLISTFFENNIT
jgi:hypothetical protein